MILQIFCKTKETITSVFKTFFDNETVKDIFGDIDDTIG